MQQETKTVELTGAEIFVRCLQEEGADLIFGYPGGSVLHIYDALYRQDKVKHILVRHEQGAVHAAEGFAKSTGKPGVVLVTSGPGATNAVTGIADAYMDSVPMVIFTGQVPTSLIGNDAFQEVDTVGITRPCVKHNFLVKDVKDLATTIKKAFYVATTGRPGPVVVDIPKDITAARFEFSYPKSIKMRSYNPTVKGHPGQIRKAVDLILSAKKPMLYTGGGVILGNAAKSLTELTRLLNYPITNTLMGLGGYPASDRQFLGMLGMHGTYEANMAMHHADVLIAIGARFDDRVTGNIEKFCPHARIVHVDVDPASISKNVKVDVPIVGQVDQVLKTMIKEIKASGARPDPDALADWWKQIDEWRAMDCLKYDKTSELIKPQYVLETLWRLTKGDAFVCSDVGQHQMWTAQFYGFDKPNRWINSGGLGTMGFGLPAAIGTQIAHPDETVVCVTGEASIQMCIQELSTALQYHLPIKVVTLNNRYMGMVRQWQEFFYQGRYAMSYMDALPDFVQLAEAYGHVGMRIEQPGDVEGAIQEALKMKDRLVFMDFITDQSENVYPMVPAGAGQNEMILL
ncbi:acetolactate synthase 3 large subunit [Ectothiorhodospira lacustris]|uniref:acetolactate synthase 3 large subunit n=1 Tax=Ectothiorhodospira lacustris TaxID=2899127 RepID=UPI001EE93099|nr:acetolactate synthase 3 large subunit [Ectothiorhodospira lacustris]MCG5499580.1 acetolactate synthase 3 large subunit [Ectothiorhodospira lacustris]MCG5508726.1 acetolactate synthase 3 large subunit [Ectothiorhodospira lacustris]MCG5520517.1 acetolactate synthase 3 large subunit [Ectothiorhodospira lacustris]